MLSVLKIVYQLQFYQVSKSAKIPGTQLKEIKELAEKRSERYGATLTVGNLV